MKVRAHYVSMLDINEAAMELIPQDAEVCKNEFGELVIEITIPDSELKAPDIPNYQLEQCYELP